MKSTYLCFVLVVSAFLLTSCNSPSNSDIQSNLSSINPSSVSTDNSQASTSDLVQEKRAQVIKKFKEEREVIGTGKFIEDAYNQFPEDDVISVIYFYMTAVDCQDFYSFSENKSWLEEAKLNAARIPPSYEGEFSNEIIPFVQDLLGDEWGDIADKSLKLDSNFSNLTLEDKVKIYDFIQSQYHHYDQLEGKSTGDKYSDAIFEEAANKYEISVYQVNSIWIDTDVLKAATSKSSSQSATESAGTTSYTQTPTDNEMGFAWAAAKQEVKGKLKAPSTAKFPTYNDATIKKNGNKFKVVGYVDAKNSYGAKLRVSFTVEFKKTGEESYVPISVVLDE